MAKEDVLIVGEIQFSEYDISEIPIDESVSLLEYGMGKIKLEACNCIIKVYDRKGTIPHFHIEGDLNTVIEIYRPAYFKHGIYQDSLTRKQKKELNDWMHANKCERWKKISDFWKSHNFESNPALYTNTAPDYTKLP